MARHGLLRLLRRDRLLQAPPGRGLEDPLRPVSARRPPRPDGPGRRRCRAADRRVPPKPGSLPPQASRLGAEKIREFADAIGAGSDVHRDHDAAKSAGFRDLVAPPMFCVVYSARAMGRAILAPAVGITLATMLHGSRESGWAEPVCDGDVIE